MKSSFKSVTPEDTAEVQELEPDFQGENTARKLNEKDLTKLLLWKNDFLASSVVIVHLK